MSKGEITWKLVLTIILATFGGSFQFFNVSGINQSQLILQNWTRSVYNARYDTELSDSTITLIYSFTVSAVSFGGILGSLLTRLLADRFGRRGALVINGCISVVGAAFSGAAKSVNAPEFLIFGRLVQGIGAGAASGLVPLYLTECAPVKYRGAVGSIHQLVVSFADFISLIIGMPEVLGGVDLWPINVALTGIPALLMAILLPFCRESPRYLLMTRKRVDLAQDSIKFFSGTDHMANHMRALTREAAFNQLYTGGKITSIRKLIGKREVRLPLLISVLVMCGQQFTGCASVFSYSTDMFLHAGLSAVVAKYATVFVGLGYFLFTVPSIYLIERLGRRRLSIFQISGCLFSLVAMSTLTGVSGRFPSNVGLSYGTIAALMLYMCIYGLGSPIPWIMASELFDQQNRSTAVTINTLVSWTLAFIISLAYLPLEQAAGPALSYLPFIIVLSVILGLMVLFLPETRNKSIDNIVSEFRRRKNTISRTVHPSYSRVKDEQQQDLISGHKYSTYGAVWRNEEVMSDIEEYKEGHPLLIEAS